MPPELALTIPPQEPKTSENTSKTTEDDSFITNIPASIKPTLVLAPEPIVSKMLLPKPAISNKILTQQFWFGNRTPFSIKADRQMKEYFYHCIRNFDFPMRLNYCWNFSINHQNMFKKTIIKPYKFSKVYAKRAASVVGEKILLKRASGSESQVVKEKLSLAKELELVKLENPEEKLDGEKANGEREKIRVGRFKGYNVRKKFANVTYRTQRFLKNLPPFKKESIVNGGSGIFGQGIMNSFTVKNLIARRKKSAPEQETKKYSTSPYIEPDDEYTIVDSECMSSYHKAASQFANIATSPGTHVYYIYLTESCCVEVSATQQNSTVQNILIQSLRKIKANEESNEYCLVEHIEQEKTTSTSDASNLATTLNAQTTTNDKIIIKTRILRPNESLFVLSHVWNQMKLDKKDGFRNAKIILTKKQAPVLPGTMGSRKPTGLLKHRFSLQPKSSPRTTHTTTTTTTTKIATFKNNDQSAKTTDQKQKTLTASRLKTKTSLNRLVRQKSFDESFEMPNIHSTIAESPAKTTDQLISGKTSPVPPTNSPQVDTPLVASSAITQEQETIEIQNISAKQAIETTTTVTTTTTTIDEIKPLSSHLDLNPIRRRSDPESRRKSSFKSIKSRQEPIEAQVEKNCETRSGSVTNALENSAELEDTTVLRGNATVISGGEAMIGNKARKQSRQSNIQRFFKLKI